MTIPDDFPTCDCPPGPCAHYPYNAVGRFHQFRQGTSGLPRGTEVAYLRQLAVMPEQSLMQKAVTLGGAVIRHVATGMTRVTDEVFAQRRAACEACEFRDVASDSCRKCGCTLGDLSSGPLSKLRWASEQCPDEPPRWFRVAEGSPPSV